MGFTERLQFIIDANAKGAISGMNQTGSAATGLQAKTGLLETGMKQLGVTGIKTGDLLKAGVAGGAVVAGAAIAKFALDGVDKMVGLAAEVRNFQRVSGASAEDSSRFVAVLDDMGIKSETGAKGIFKLAREVANGAPQLAQFGVEVQKNRDGTTDLTGTLLNVADAYSETEDPAKRAAIAQAAFGKAGKDLIPILEQGRKGLKEFFEGAEQGHQILSQEDLQQAREYELAMDHLSDTVRGVQMELGSALVPAIASGTEGVASFIDTLDRGVGPVNLLNTGVGMFVDNLMGPGVNAVGSVSSLLRGDFMGAVEGGIRTVPILGDAVADLIPGFGAAEDAGTKMKDAQENLAEAQKRVATLALEGKQGTKEYAEAQRDARTAGSELADIQGKVQKSMQDTASSVKLTNDELNKLINMTLGAAGASLNQQQAVAALAQAERDQVAAQLELTAAQDAHGASSLEAIAASEAVDAADRKVEAAKLALAQATINLDTVTKAETETLKGNTGAADQEIARLREMQRAHPEAAAAIQPLIDRLIFLKASVDNVPGHKKTHMEADTEGAKREIDDLKRKIDAIPSYKRVVVEGIGTVSGTISRLLERQSGGPIPGSPAQGVPVMAHGGEYVLSADVVQRIRTGAISRGAGMDGGSVFAGGGGGGNTYQINVRVDALSDPGRVGAAIVESITAFERRNGTSWRN